MKSMVRSAALLASRIRKNFLSEPCVYWTKRDGKQHKVHSTPEEKAFSGPSFYGFVMYEDSQVFIFLKSYFMRNGVFTPPQEGDAVFKNYNGRTMRHDVAKANDGPCWGWNGLGENEIAVHTRMARKRS